MSSNKAAFIAIAAVVIVALVITTIFEYQQTGLLRQNIEALQTKNNDLANTLALINRTMTSVTLPSKDNDTYGNTILNSNQMQSNDNDGSSNYSSQTITAVAVRAVPVTNGFFQSVKYEGTVMGISVDIKDGGKGLILVDTGIPTGVDFQTAAKTAVKVAQSFTAADRSRKDIIFSITSRGNSSSDLQAVDGPSAGAAMTTLLISELQNKKIDPTILITGTINLDGSIGPVGGVPEKAQAAGNYGAKIFLIPSGQSMYMEQVCQDKQEGPIFYRSCQSEQKPLSDLTENNFGMKTIEVKDISGALQYLQA